MRPGVVSVIGVVALGLAIGPAYAQKSSATGRAFDSLSIGNQKVASALYQAQSGSTSTPLTLDEIAAKKQSGTGWGEVFKSMKAQGLVQEKNLGQVVSKYNHSSHGVVTTTSGRVVSGSTPSSQAQGAKLTGEGSTSPGNSGNVSSTSTGSGHAVGAGNSSAGGAAHGNKGGK